MSRSPIGPTISVVIPVFNEPEWIPRSVESVAKALSASEWGDAEIVIVDDGSTDATSTIVDGLECNLPVRPIHTTNRGRLAARQTGIEEACHDFILLLDARVLVTRGLGELVEQIGAGRRIWNAHCDINVGRNLLAAFWDAIPRIFWWAYHSNPRTLSFGIEDFVRYPKGTTCFLAPRKSLLDAYGHFSTKFSDPRDANDDTLLIEELARKERIWISPDFACLYQPRQRLLRFMPHAFHRGIVFVDAYLRPGNPYLPAIVGFCVASVGLLASAVRKPWTIPAALAAAAALAVGAGVLRRLPPRHLAALGLVTPLFAVSYGSGIWMGLAKAAFTRLERRGGVGSRAV